MSSTAAFVSLVLYYSETAPRSTAECCSTSLRIPFIRVAIVVQPCHNPCPVLQEPFFSIVVVAVVCLTSCPLSLVAPCSKRQRSPGLKAVQAQGKIQPSRGSSNETSWRRVDARTFVIPLSFREVEKKGARGHTHSYTARSQSTPP